MTLIKYYQTSFGQTPPSQTNKKTCLIKFRTGQYMGHAQKQLFFSIEAFPSWTCPIWNSIDAGTWLHVLLKCKQQHIHALITKRHNKVIWEIRKLILSTIISRHYILMNAWSHNEIPQENTYPTWLLLCTCDAQRCHCNARLKPDTLCIIGHPYNHPHQKPLHRISPYNS
jgi:hypothetical protein